MKHKLFSLVVLLSLLGGLSGTGSALAQSHVLSQPAANALTPGGVAVRYHYALTFGERDVAYLADHSHLNYPWGVNVVGNSLWMGEMFGNRAMKFSSDGTFQAEVGSAGNRLVSDTSLNSISDVTQDSAGNIWVVDADAAHILEFDPAGNYLTQLGVEWEQGTDNAHFGFPAGIAFDAAGNMYVSDGSPQWNDNAGNHRIQVFNSSGSYLATIGHSGLAGTGGGYLNGPRHIAIDGSRLFVADTGNDRIQIFNISDPSAPAYVRTLAPAGDQAFNQPSGVAVDAHYLYVADTENARVEIFDRMNSYAWVTTIGAGWGTADDQFKRPSDVAVDAAGNLYVADFVNARVQQFHLDAGPLWNLVRTYGSTGVPYVTDSSHFNHPAGVAIDGSGNIYLSEFAGKRVLKLDSTGGFIWQAGITGVVGDWDISNDVFDEPADLALDGAGHVFVVDRWNNRIQIFDAGSGAYVNTISDANNQCLGGLTVANGLIYVANSCASIVQVYDATTYVLDDLQQIGEANVSGSDNAHFNWPEDVAVDPSGNIYVSDQNNNRVQVFDSARNYVRTLGVTGGCEGDNAHLCAPDFLLTDAAGRLFVSDTWNNRVQVFETDGTYSSTIGEWGYQNGQFVTPTGVAGDAEGNVYVADRETDRLQKFTPGIGTMSGVMKDLAGNPITGTSLAVILSTPDNQQMGLACSDPATGQYTVVGLPFDVAMVALGGQQPDCDYNSYGWEYYNHQPFIGDPITLTSLQPDLAGADFSIGTGVPAMEYFLFNFKNPILQDRAVRRAVAYGTDRQGILEQAWVPNNDAEWGVLQNSYVASNAWGKAPDSLLTVYSFDPATARQTLQAAGWTVPANSIDGIRYKNGTRLSLSFKTTQRPSRRATGQLFKKWMRDIGIDIHLSFIPGSLYFGPLPDGTVASGNFDIAEYTMDSSCNNTENKTCLPFSWFNEGDPANVFDYSATTSPTAYQAAHDVYVAAQSDLLTDQQRLDLDYQHQQIITADVPILALFTRVDVPRVNTPTGTDVTVTPDSSVSLSFDQVTQSGFSMAVAIATSSGDLPAGVEWLPTIYEVGSNATFSTADACFTYDDTGLTLQQEGQLRLYHQVDATWVDVTDAAYPNTDTNQICGLVSSFSPFSIGAPTFAADPRSWNYGLVKVGTSSAQMFTITNNGLADLHVSSVALAGANAGQFHITSNTCMPDPVLASGSCTVTVALTPTGKGSKVARLQFTDDAAGSPQIIYLSGKGATETALNRGFETYKSLTARIPSSWTATNFVAPDGKTTTVMQQGAAAVMIVGDSGKAKTLTQTRIVSGQAGNSFLPSLWRRADSLTGVAGTLRAQVLFYNGTALVQTKTIAFPGGTYDWTQESLTFKASQPYTQVVIKLRFGKGTGTAWFDSLSLLKSP